MNRISLYEAIRRKKESQGLNTASKPAPSVDPNKRAEPRVQLKQPLGQEKPAIPVKQAVKPPVMRPLSHKSSLFKKPQKDSWLKWASISGIFKKNPMTTRVVIGGVIVVVVILGLFSLLKSQPDSQQPAEPTVPTVAVNKKTQVPQKTGETKVPEPKPVVPKQADKPAPIRQPVAAAPVKPAVTAPVKQVEVPKTEPKVQIPAAIQSELQKKAETAQAQAAPKPAGKGDNVIVIVTYTKQDDLIPVAAYFRQNGIDTEVIREGSYFFLVTKERYENPGRNGTDGHRALQAIKRIGANYKAPSGYEKFSSTPFQDAYGKKVK